MRLWSLHPCYLDPKGLVALWREALLAQAVLHGETRGYRNHPQLERFRCHQAPLDAIAGYLRAVHAEAVLRGYSFDWDKIRSAVEPTGLAVTSGQLAHEWAHLLAKLALRSPALNQKWQDVTSPQPHPMFTVHAGGIETWERP